MKILINFSEIHSLAMSKTGRELVLSVMNERTVKAETKVSIKVPLLGEIEKTIGLKNKDTFVGVFFCCYSSIIKLKGCDI